MQVACFFQRLNGFVVLLIAEVQPSEVAMGKRGIGPQIDGA